MKKFTASEIAQSTMTYLADDLGLSEQDLIRAVMSLIDFGDLTPHQIVAREHMSAAIVALDRDENAR